MQRLAPTVGHLAEVGGQASGAGVGLVGPDFALAFFLEAPAVQGAAGVEHALVDALLFLQCALVKATPTQICEDFANFFFDFLDALLRANR